MTGKPEKTSDRGPVARSTLPEILLAWLATLASCAYLYWAYTVMVRHTAAFEEALGPVAAELPGATRFLLAHRVWLYPAVFGTTGLLLVAKELVLRNKRLTLVLTFAVALVALFVVDSYRTLLFSPLLEMASKCR